VLVLPALLSPQLLGRRRVAPAQQAQGLPVGGVDLAAVDDEAGRGDGTGAGQSFDVGGGAPRSTGWDWRGSPSTQTDPPGQASTAARTASTWSVGVWEISSSTTTVPAARGPSDRSMRSRAMVLASKPAPASSATALAVVATATTGRPSAAAARAAVCSIVVLP
jgi:hypothetical protein